MVERGGDDVFGPGEDGGACGFGIEHGARAERRSNRRAPGLPGGSRRCAPGTVNVTSIAVTPPEARALATSTSGLARLEADDCDDSAFEDARERLIAAHRRRFLEQLDQVIRDDRFDQVMIEAGFPGEPEVFLLAVAGDCDQGGSS